MDYEQRYKDALERAKEMCAMPTDKATMEYIFPELKENRDEQIREAIKIVIRHLETQLRCDMVDGVDTLDMYSWLEKQGHMLDPDKVIEWIDEHVPTKFEDMANYVQQFKKDFGL